jgi:hypothetical protein
MALTFFQTFRVTGAANSITYDTGLKSTESEPKRLISVLIQVAAWAGTDDNDIQGYHERAKVFDIPEKLFPQLEAATTQGAAGKGGFVEIPVDLDLPVGETFKVAIKCAATSNTVRGAYKYELTAK